MRHANQRWMRSCGAVATLGALSCWSAMSCAAVETAPPPTDIVSGAWQHHQLTFSYFGFTTLYTCDGLEDQVRRILLHLGARKDVKVSAGGCPGPFNTPSRNALVTLDFYTLAPSTDGSATVKAQWTPFELTPHRPGFMGDGDCELIQEMKDLISRNFSLRGVDYRANCVPHQVTLDGFEVKGQALRAPSNPPAG
jgi:hypothetical protein